MQTARTYSSLIDAQLAVSYLANHSIEAYVMDEHLAALDSVVNFTTGIRVSVSDQDYEKAAQLLTELINIQNTDTQ
ncbi:MAG: DUF2007 domain-containing protein [Akkermansiaceae bacterium]